MRLIETQTQWGNNYRRDYFANGKRVTESEFDRLRDSEMRLHPMASMAGKTENTSYGFRTIWES